MIFHLFPGFIHLFCFLSATPRHLLLLLLRLSPPFTRRQLHPIIAISISLFCNYLYLHVDLVHFHTYSHTEGKIPRSSPARRNLIATIFTRDVIFINATGAAASRARARARHWSLRKTSRKTRPQAMNGLVGDTLNKPKRVSRGLAFLSDKARFIKRVKRFPCKVALQAARCIGASHVHYDALYSRCSMRIDNLARTIAARLVKRAN